MTEICGKSYFTRRSMREFPRKETCGLPAHEGNRHGQPKTTIPSEEPSGTCQACFRTQQTRNGLLVLHGYKRPGTGYIIGHCYGHGYAPWEVSCERTKEFLNDVIRPHLTRAQDRLARLQADPSPETLQHTARLFVGYAKTTRKERGYAEVHVYVPRDAPEGYVETSHLEERDVHYSGPMGQRRKGQPMMAHHPSYAQLLTWAVTAAQNEIKRVMHDITFYEGKILAWQPSPWPILAQGAMA